MKASFISYCFNLTNYAKWSEIRLGVLLLKIFSRMKNLPAFERRHLKFFVELSISEQVNNSRLSKWYKYTVKP